MRKIAVCLTKGGVGKTVTAVNLSAGLAQAGSKVLLVDTDTQGQAGDMLGIRPDAGLAELISGELGPDEIIIQARDNLWLLAGGRTLAGVKLMIAKKEYGAENTLKDVLAPIQRRYEYIILDTSPGWDSLTVNVLFYVQEILAPVSLEIATLNALLEFTKNLTDIRKYNKKLSLKYIVPTFLDGRVKKSSELYKQLQAHFEKQICPPIRYNVRLSEALGFGQTIYEYAPKSPGAKDYQKLTERISHDSKKNS